MPVWHAIEMQLQDVLGEPVNLSAPQTVGGGSINQSCRVNSGQQSWFVKLNRAESLGMFVAEAEGLKALSEAGALRIPQPLCWGHDDQQAWLVMESLELGGSGDAVELAEGLASVHRIQSARFGWHRDNTIGSTPQINTQHPDWVSFWRENRLGYQLKLAADKGYGGELQSLGEKLMADLPVLFNRYQPLASMMHGDLWGGNLAALADGTPVIYDPAFYYGDREADLAMTQLFGGFGRRFYDAYNEAWPLDDGYSVRKTFYNLYHIINHLNMFGGGYHGQAVSMLEQILSDMG